MTWTSSSSRIGTRIFSAEAVAAYLSNSPRTILVSSPEVIERVRQAAPPGVASRLRSELPPPGGVSQVMLIDVQVSVLRLRHNSTSRLPEQHLGFLIGESKAVLHVGDADPSAANVARLKTVMPYSLLMIVVAELRFT